MVDDPTRKIPTTGPAPRAGRQRVPRGVGQIPAAGSARPAAGGARPVAGGSRAPDAPPGAGVRRSAAERAPQSRESTGPRGPRGLKFRMRPRTWIILALIVLLGYPIALGLVAWRGLGRVDALPADSAATPGRTYLVVGSDSRRGLSSAQRKELSTGSAAGNRTDTIMLLHIPAGGGPTVLMSVPRDSYVEIPGKGANKINAAFSFGGPKLLAQTIESAMGVQIDDYVEIGFGGFAEMVTAVGGVEICPKRAMNDPKAGINLKPGCQPADGPKALGYARARYSDPRGDFGRVERQREVLAAIVAKGTKPGTLINPFRAFPLASAGGGTLTVDEQTGPLALARFVLGMKSVAGGGGLSLTVPVSGTGSRRGAGSVVLWDRDKSAKVFNALKVSDTELIRPMAKEQAKLIAKK